MKVLIISLVTLVAVLAVVLMVFNASTSYGQQSTNTQEVTLKVDGMTCGMCPLTIKTALKKLNGVVDADVSYKDKEAKVLYEGGKVTVYEIVKAIEDAGNYKAIPLRKEEK
jgi:mercuric ion binding protein